ncbi:hypothetical protein FDZ74_17810, partial [bacterium]
MFLLGGFLLYALGAAAAARAGFAIHWPAYLLGQLVVTSIQLSAHYANEYYDREVDRLAAQNRTWFSGGSGILPTGVISPAAVRTAAFLCAELAVGGGVLAGIHSPWMFAIVALSLPGSWFYSAPPLTLMSSGWGELTTSLIVVVGVPLAGYVMQAGPPPAQFWPVCLPLLLLHGAMLMAFEIPDFDVDRSLGKRTLTVRLGLPRAAGSGAPALVLGVLTNLQQTNTYALLSSALTMALLLAVKRINKRLPAELVAIFVVGAIAYAGQWSGQGLRLVRDMGSLQGAILSFHVPALTLADWQMLLPSAGAVALFSLVEAMSIAQAIALSTGERVNA